MKSLQMSTGGDTEEFQGRVIVITAWNRIPNCAVSVADWQVRDFASIIPFAIPVGCRF